MVYKVNDLRQLEMILRGQMDVKNKTFSYAVEKNMAKIESALKKSQRKLRQFPAFADNQEFDKEFLPKYAELEKKFGQPDGFGGVKRNEETEEIIPLDKDAYQKELAVLSEEYPGFVDLLGARIHAMKEIGELEYEIEFYKVQNDAHLPNDMSARDRVNLRFMFADKLIPEEALADKELEGVEDIEAPENDEVREVKKDTKEEDKKEE
jgi:hypothetical protein